MNAKTGQPQKIIFLIISLIFYDYQMLLGSPHQKALSLADHTQVVNEKSYSVSGKQTDHVFEWAQNNDIIARLLVGLRYRNTTKVSIDHSVEWLKRAASQGNARAQYHLGICYSQGLGVEKNTEQALKWFLYADQTGFVPAQFLIIQADEDRYFNKDEQQKCLENGILAYKNDSDVGKYEGLIEYGLSCECGDVAQRDVVAACKLYMQAGHKNFDSLCHLLRCYEYAQQGVDGYQKCMELLNDADFCYLLGVAYYFGIGCQIDEIRAKKMFEFASSHNHGGALYYQAEMLAVSRGGETKKNHEKPPGLFHKALGYLFDSKEEVEVSKVYYKAIEHLYDQAERGWEDAQMALGLCYIYDKGVEKDFEEAFTWLLKAANQGSPDAQWHVGYSYLHGEGVEQNEQNAYTWLLRAAKSEHVDAQYLLGWLLAYGSQIPRDDKSANEWLEKAANGDNAEAQYLLAIRCSEALGMAYHDNKVIKWMRSAASKGHKDAQYLLGTFYDDGLHTKLDGKEAFRWFSAAALQGHIYAKFRLSFCMELGRGCAKNHEEAVRNCVAVIDQIEKEAREGSPEAQNMLGLAFQYGLGKQVDLGRAKQCYEKAAIQGYSCGQSNLAILCVASQEEKAMEMYLKAAQQGSPYATFSLGVMLANKSSAKKYLSALQFARFMFLPGVYEVIEALVVALSVGSKLQHPINCFTIAAQRGLTDGAKKLEELMKSGNIDAHVNYALCLYYGWGCERNYKESAKILQIAASKNVPLAKANLGECYYFGRGVVRDYKKAVELFQSPGVDGGEALFYLGECYYFGRGAKINTEKAVGLYERAARKDNAKAAYKLALCYFDGIGIPKNEKKADELFRQAVRLLTNHLDYDDDLEIIYLGYCYENGFGVLQNYSHAFDLYLRAAEHGEAEAQVNLAYLYNNGYGVRQDFERAFYWYKSAAEQGQKEGRFSLGNFYAQGVEGVVEQNDEQAIKWYRLAAEQGLSGAQHSLAVLYEKSKNFKESFGWYKQAAESGMPEAQFKLSNCYREGLGTEVDMVQAKRWRGKAERNGYVVSK